MSTPPKTPAPKPTTPIKVDVINPRYQGATFEMVADALLQRPRKRPDQDGSNELRNEPDGRNKVNRE